MPDISSSIYTPEYSQNFLAGQLAPLQEGEAAAEGQAYAEGDAGGIIGKFSTAGKIGASRAANDIAKSSIIGQFNQNAANAAYGERMTNEQQQFQASEAQKQRDFQESITKMGYQFQDQEREAQRRSDNTITSATGLGLASGVAAQVLSSM